MVIKFAPPRPVYPTADPLLRDLASWPLWARRIFLRKRVGPERYPRFRYKYKAIASGTPEEREKRAHQLRDILVEGRLWLSSPRDFNDPFDMTAHVIFEPKSMEDLRQRFKRALKDSGKSWKERQTTLDKLMSEDRSALLARAEKSFARHFDTTGVFSFAGDPRSILMWSHYGDHHTGICLQFEVARDPESMMQAVRMEYVKEYPVINYAEDIHDQIRKPLQHKFKRWKYEDEWRIVWPDGARTYLAIKPEAVVGLIFGCRASDATINVVRDLLEEREKRGLPRVTTYRAYKHDSRYKLRLRRM
jgi:hypothetical protein